MAKRNHKLSQTAIRRNLTDPTMPTASDARANLLAVWQQATEEEIEQGFDWYLRAHDLACQLHSSPTHGAGIIAALSPSTSWDNNVEGATHLATTGTAWLYQSDLFNRRALAIRNGADPGTTLGGPKVRSFWRNIAEPWRNGPVTIDRHALAILIGRPLRDNDKRLERRGMYVWTSAVYRSLARELGVPVTTLQAVTWLTWRRLYGSSFRAQHRHDLDEMF